MVTKGEALQVIAKWYREEEDEEQRKLFQALWMMAAQTKKSDDEKFSQWLLWWCVLKVAARYLTEKPQAQVICGDRHWGMMCAKTKGHISFHQNKDGKAWN